VTELPSARVPPARIVPVEVDGAEYVVWRGVSGVLGSAPRWCPHLDWDLTEGTVVDDELVCTGHGWSFDCAGHAFKRTEAGRVDPKDDIATVQIVESNGTIALSR
jgi:phenylpropionate dioxygenase-like ring-hydroxylating dioxygenase large terminal subunit